MTVTRRLAAILAADCDEISETGLLVALLRRFGSYRDTTAVES
jgi:hypothetical protein